MPVTGPELLDDPVAAELLASTQPAHLAYLWTDGTPRVVPMWFHWDGTDVVLGTFARSPKAKALHDGAMAALTIDSAEQWPYHSLAIRGPVKVTRTDGVVPEYELAARRYFGDEQGAAWVAGAPSQLPMLRIALRPQHVTVLDFESRFPSALSG